MLLRWGNLTCPKTSIAWVVPLPAKSHNKDYDIFRFGDPYKPHLPQLVGGGTS